MSLKAIIDGILKEKHRPLSWLATGMGKTFDGLRLGLINESIKYKDLLLMAEILEISAAKFFKETADQAQSQSILAESAVEYGDNLKSCKELAATLKDQLKDKERIIALLSEAKN